VCQGGNELTRQFARENQIGAFSSVLVRCLAARGQIQECRELGEATLRRALDHGIAVAAADARLGLAELELSLGHGAAARDLIEAVSHPLISLIAGPYLVEAALLSGDSELPRTAVDALAYYAEQAHDPVLLGLVVRSRALLAASTGSAESYSSRHCGLVQNFTIRFRVDAAHPNLVDIAPARGMMWPCRGGVPPRRRTSASDPSRPPAGQSHRTGGRSASRFRRSTA
jgi:hypothetical protein